ncbi:hypothetical protein [Rouxiella chamberiensis]|uniref:Uncharacterized protein n=1 Tax=Rouxiella chamberiensis TaxID=1513468 RepID=A0ABY7HSS2_9GAMM|nr:hypothetical protein [Rouxiella chamberiensis]WAT01886.1 hypothetical protein O1V66_04035 [Rouxiella chamberiensis]
MNNLLLDAKVNPTLNPDPIPVALQVGFDLAAVMHLKRLDAGGNRASSPRSSTYQGDARRLLKWQAVQQQPGKQQHA